MTASNTGSSKGSVLWRKWGINPAVSNVSAPEDVWFQGGIYTYESGMNLYVSADSALDKSILVRIQGMDELNVEVEKDVTTDASDGRVFVPVPGTWNRVYSAHVASGAPAVGNIYISNSNVDSNGDGIPDVLARIKAKLQVNHNQTAMAMYTVPAGRTGYIGKVGVGALKRQDAWALVSLRVREPGSVFRTRYILPAHSSGGWVNRTFDQPILVPALTDIKLTVDEVSTAGSMRVVAEFSLFHI